MFMVDKEAEILILLCGTYDLGYKTFIIIL